MANVTISPRGGNKITINFGDYANEDRFPNRIICHKSQVVLVGYGKWVNLFIPFITIKFDLTSEVEPGGPRLLIVDSVDGVAPTSNSDLFNKIRALL